MPLPAEAGCYTSWVAPQALKPHLLQGFCLCHWDATRRRALLPGGKSLRLLISARRRGSRSGRELGRPPRDWHLTLVLTVIRELIQLLNPLCISLGIVAPLRERTRIPLDRDMCREGGQVSHIEDGINLLPSFSLGDSKKEASIVVRFSPPRERDTWKISQIMEILDSITLSWSYPTTWLIEWLLQLSRWWAITANLSRYPRQPARSPNIMQHTTNCSWGITCNYYRGLIHRWRSQRPWLNSSTLSYKNRSFSPLQGIKPYEIKLVFSLI